MRLAAYADGSKPVSLDRVEQLAQIGDDATLGDGSVHCVDVARRLGAGDQRGRPTRGLDRSGEDRGVQDARERLPDRGAQLLPDREAAVGEYLVLDGDDRGDLLGSQLDALPGGFRVCFRPVVTQ